jgi:hypothetical protein
MVPYTRSTIATVKKPAIKRKSMALSPRRCGALEVYTIRIDLEAVRNPKSKTAPYEQHKGFGTPSWG